MNDEDEELEDFTKYATVWDQYSAPRLLKSLADDQVESKFKAKPTPNYKKIADAVMRELVANGLEDMILIKNDDVREWWGDVVAEENRIKKEQEKAERARQKKLDDLKALEVLMNRLTPEEKRLLKLKEAKK